MSEMVERVARAICIKRLGYECRMRRPIPYKATEPLKDMSCGCGYLSDMHKYARAAIQAMRVPTQEMQVSGRSEIVRDFLAETDAVLAGREPGDTATALSGNVWRAMIDEALK